MSNVNHKIQLVTFFYAKEVPLGDLCEIERRTLTATDWGHEVGSHFLVDLSLFGC